MTRGHKEPRHRPKNKLSWLFHWESGSSKSWSSISSMSIINECLCCEAGFGPESDWNHYATPKHMILEMGNWPAGAYDPGQFSFLNGRFELDQYRMVPTDSSSIPEDESSSSEEPPSGPGPRPVEFLPNPCLWYKWYTGDEIDRIVGGSPSGGGHYWLCLIVSIICKNAAYFGTQYFGYHLDVHGELATSMPPTEENYANFFDATTAWIQPHPIDNKFWCRTFVKFPVDGVINVNNPCNECTPTFQITSGS